MTDFPRMRGNARMALGASEFDVPLFSHISGPLWTGCSPAEFPDEWEERNYDWRVDLPFAASPVRCHWLWRTAGVDDNDPVIKTKTVGMTTLLLPQVPRFDAILNLFPWGEYVVPENIVYREEELYDSVEVCELEQLDDLAKWVLDRVHEHKTVLVHCQAGLNRSALVAARTLMLLGTPADEAIRLLRENRSPMVLCNPHFERYLLRLRVPTVGEIMNDIVEEAFPSGGD